METSDYKGEKRYFQDTGEDILEAISNAGAIAIAENKALGLPTTYLKDGKIIKESVDGSIEVLGMVKKTSSQTYTKGQIIHVETKK